MAIIELRGKVALVTGSARRVGKAIALELARQGMHQVITHSGSDKEAAETAQEIRALGVEAIVFKADQRQPIEIEHLFETVRQHFGRLDLLVNSASSFKTGSILDTSLEEWNDIMALNLTGPFLCSQHAARLMREKGEGGSIINILDITALRPRKRFPAHSVSKVGLHGLTAVLALSLAPDIRVNAIAPGTVLRDAGNTPEQWEEMGKKMPLGRTGDPVDVAQAVIFLATQPYITGETLRVDGGDYLR